MKKEKGRAIRSIPQENNNKTLWINLKSITGASNPHEISQNSGQTEEKQEISEQWIKITSNANITIPEINKLSSNEEDTESNADIKTDRVKKDTSKKERSDQQNTGWTVALFFPLISIGMALVFTGIVYSIILCHQQIRINSTRIEAESREMDKSKNIEILEEIIIIAREEILKYKKDDQVVL